MPLEAEDKGLLDVKDGRREESGWKETEVEDVSSESWAPAQTVKSRGRDGPDWQRDVEVRAKSGQKGGREHHGGHMTDDLTWKLMCL